MSLRYVPHIIYSLALTSISIHLLYQRRAAEEDRVKLSAKISILESLVHRLDQGERINRAELGRSRRLAGLLDSTAPEFALVDSNIRWKDVVLGREQSSSTAWDQKDWEKVEQEMKSSR